MKNIKAIIIGVIVFNSFLFSAPNKKYAFEPSEYPQIIKEIIWDNNERITIIRVDKFARKDGNNWVFEAFWDISTLALYNKVYVFTISINGKEYPVKVIPSKPRFNHEIRKTIYLDQAPTQCFIWIEQYDPDQEPPEAYIPTEPDYNSYGNWEE